MVSNGSYQILQGLVERGWWGDRRALLFVGRAGGRSWRSPSEGRASGLQAVTGGAAAATGKRCTNCVSLRA